MSLFDVEKIFDMLVDKFGFITVISSNPREFSFINLLNEDFVDIQVSSGHA